MIRGFPAAADRPPAATVMALDEAIVPAIAVIEGTHHRDGMSRLVDISRVRRQPRPGYTRCFDLQLDAPAALDIAGA
jgi:hypothetical protein